MGQITPNFTYQLDDYVPRGSCFKGYINAPYQDLIDAFGEPNVPAGDKVWTEWSIRFSDGDDDIYATIYDWKEPHAYVSHVGEYRWHIGGKQKEALWCVMDVLNAPESMERIYG